MENDNKFFYLSASITATLAATRVTLFSLKKLLFTAVALFSLETFVITLSAVSGHAILSVVALVISALTLVWSLWQVYGATKIETDLQEALILWRKELGDLSGDFVVDANMPSDKQSRSAHQKIRVIQRFLELISSSGGPSL
jgi:hypothetical protein